jgi:hypothetical protein
MKSPCAQSRQRKLSQLHINWPRLRLRQDGCGIAQLDTTQGKACCKAVDPAGFNSFLEHGNFS